MDDVYQKNFNDFNTINMPRKISSYAPCTDYYPMHYFQNIQSFNPFFNQFNKYNAEMKNEKKPIENKNVMKIETDSDLIQDLTGNYLGQNLDETTSEEKTDKKEIEINLGKIIVENNFLTNFPMIKIKNSNKYNISIPENILNKGEFFTAIKDNRDDKDMNEIEMVDEERSKEVISDDYLIDINDNIKNNILQFMNKNEILLCLKNKQLILKNLIEKIYDKCLFNILEIKRNVKNRVKKIKSIDLSNQLNNLIKFHNELISLYLSTQNNNNDQNMNNNNNINIIINQTNENEDENKNENASYTTYAQLYLQNCGKTFKCEICGKMFVNYQTLGGHMSKIHPNCSEKYKKQNDIRKKREGQRKLLDLVKEKLFEKYNLNYRLLKKNDEKEKIKTFIKAHQKEYEILKRKIYKENALKKDEKDE